MSQDSQFGREGRHVDDNDVTGLRRDDAARVRLSKTKDDVVTVGVVGKDSSNRRKTTHFLWKNEPVTGLVEHGEVVVDVVDFNVNFRDDFRRFGVANFELVTLTRLVVEDEGGDQLPTVVRSDQFEIRASFVTLMFVVSRRQRHVGRRRIRRQNFTQRSVDEGDRRAGGPVLGHAAEQTRDLSARLDTELDRDDPGLIVKLFAD